jgi:hypothetical protein
VGRVGVCRLCPVDVEVFPIDVEALLADVLLSVGAEALPAGTKAFLVGAEAPFMAVAVVTLERFGAPGVLLSLAVLGVRRL